MKRELTFCCIALSITLSCTAQPITHPTDCYETICKLWGATKYFSPAANVHFLDWDSLLCQKLDYLNTTPEANIDSLYSSFFFDSDEYPQYYDTAVYTHADSLFLALEIDLGLDHLLKAPLTSLFRCRYDSLKYVRYIFPQGTTGHLGEDDREQPDYPDFCGRMVSLYRYWNIIFYFYPYKELIPEKWNDVLARNITPFMEAGDALAYHMVFKALAVSIHDSHSYITSGVFYDQLHRKQLPLYFLPMHDSLMVEFALNPVEFVEDLSIVPGDIVLEIDHKDLTYYREKYLKFCNGSNIHSKNYRLGAYAKWTMLDTVPIVYVHNGEIVEGHILSVEDSLLYPRYLEVSNLLDTIRIIDEKIAYVNLEYWEPAQIPKLMAEVYNTEAIIFDLRTYPQFSMYSLLTYFPHDTTTATFAGWVPTRKHPGRFNHFTVEKQTQFNDSIYNGDVIILVDINSLSRSEFYAMALQVCDNSTTIGSTTSGADGDVSTVTVPGNIKTWFSGIAIEYEDGTKTQQVGVRIDVPLTLTSADYKKYDDPYLAKTLEWYYEGKQNHIE